MKDFNYPDYDAMKNVLRRMAFDQEEAQLRAEVDSFRQSQLDKEQAFFERLSENHPWVNRLADNVTALREIETVQIENRRLGFDKYTQDHVALEDEERQAIHEESGDFGYLDRLAYWKEKLNYPDKLIEIDPSDKDQNFEFLCFSSEKLTGNIKHFADPDYELSYDSDPENFPNTMRRESHEFWRSLHDKYGSGTVQREMFINGVDATSDFYPHRVHFEKQEPSLGEAMDWCQNLQERARNRNFFSNLAKQEYDLRYEDGTDRFQIRSRDDEESLPQQTEPVDKDTEKFETLHGLNQDGLKEFFAQDVRRAKERMPDDMER